MCYHLIIFIRLSGRYAWRTGLDYVVQPGSIHHVDGAMSFIPEILKSAFDYKTVMVGKWYIIYNIFTILKLSLCFEVDDLLQSV